MKNTQTTSQTGKADEEIGYLVRFERGNFQSGFCILEDRKVVVLNKFVSHLEAHQPLIDLLPQLQIDADKLSPESKSCFRIP
jgi:hypothetical protein